MGAGWVYARDRIPHPARKTPGARTRGDDRPPVPGYRGGPGKPGHPAGTAMKAIFWHRFRRHSGNREPFDRVFPARSNPGILRAFPGRGETQGDESKTYTGPEQEERRHLLQGTHRQVIQWFERIRIVTIRKIGNKY